ncbi:restriction endonuclease subunit S [Anabaena aphanizomenioides LEGE 00250]|uniref:Restriction endonuclease subunit S n=1 Tax=Sphaerospermopsis aphanizomenoides LEGE 00250 TaxID=2777972 RepID=A0ABR9VAA5_9CYAN|nr:restriction endonuclease subunit S [Sphaerospermopsis aphanizomenoides]MBE9235434.1 restriction endonuclease subunit S [Sphaerospermopsis aphanizomenoides LEGE 00250]
MSKWQKLKIGDLLIRSKIPIDIEEHKEYKRITIRSKHQGVYVRDKEIGKKIGTKKQFILKSGQFVMSKIDARYGAFGIAGDDVDGAIITGNFWAYDINHSLTTAEWINQYTNSPAFYDLCERASSGITHRRYLNEQIFLNHELFIPSLDEQSEILLLNNHKSQLINSLNNELNNQEKYITQLKQAILQEAISGKLTAEWRKQNPMQKGNPDTDAVALLDKIKAEKQQLITDGKLKKEKPLPPISSDEVPFSLPDGWVWCRLGEICDIKGGKRVPNGYKLKNTPTPYIYIRVSDMKNGTIDDSDLHYIDEEVYQGIKKYTISKNDIYMTIVGATIGKCGLVPEKFDGMNLTENAAKIILFIINKIFLWRCLDSPFCQAQFIDKTKQVAVQKMAINRFSSTIIPLPPLAEQKAIVEKVDYLMKQIEELEAQIKHRKQLAEELMQTVLREAFV